MIQEYPRLDENWWRKRVSSWEKLVYKSTATLAVLNQDLVYPWLCGLTIQGMDSTIGLAINHLVWQLQQGKGLGWPKTTSIGPPQPCWLLFQLKGFTAWCLDFWISGTGIVKTCLLVDWDLFTAGLKLKTCILLAWDLYTAGLRLVYCWLKTSILLA